MHGHRSILAAAGIGLSLALAVIAPAGAAQTRDLSFERGTRTVMLRMFAAEGRSTAGFNFDGHGNGHMIVTVPLGWRVDILFVNLSTLRHSLMVTQGDQNLNGPFRPAFPHAFTPDPDRGLARGGLARISFVASRAGRYLLVCAVPGDADLGMWDRLVVSARARVPGIRIVHPRPQPHRRRP